MARNAYFNPPTPGEPDVPGDGASPDSASGGAPTNRPPVPPTPLPPEDVPEQLRQARRELRAVQGELAREREQLDRVRDVLAAQRLTLSTNEEQIATWRDRMTAERQRLEAAIVELTRRQVELDATLGRRHAELTDKIAELELGKMKLDAEVAARLAEVARREQEQESAAAALRDEAARDADRIRQSARAEVLKLRESALTIMNQAKSSAQQQADIIIAGGKAKSDELKFLAEQELTAANERARTLKEQASADRAEAAREVEIASETARAQADAIIASAHAQAEQARKAAADGVKAVTGEVRAMREQAVRQLEEMRAAAEREAEAVRKSAENEAARLRAEAAAAVREATHAAETTVRQAKSSAEDQARTIVAAGKAKADELNAQAEQQLSAVCMEIDRLNKSAAAQRDRQAKDLAARVAAEEARLEKAEADFNREREQFKHDTATMQERVAKLRADEAVAAGERARLAERQATLDRERTQTERLKADLLAGRQKLDGDLAAFTARQAESVAELDRRSAVLDAGESALQELEQSLSDRSTQMDVRQAEVAALTEAMRVERENLDAERALRLGDVERGERELEAARADLAELQSQAESRSRELEQALRNVEIDARQLRRDQELARKERDEAEALARELALRGEKLTETERKVLTGWEEVRRAKTAVAESQERLDREREEFQSTSRPMAEPVRQTGLPWASYRRWAAVLVIGTLIGLAVTEASIWSAVRPYVESAGRMTLVITDTADRKTIDIAAEELGQYMASRHEDCARIGDSLIGMDWRIDGLQPGGKDELTLRFVVSGTSRRSANERADELMRGFMLWREQKLRTLGAGNSLAELNRQRDRRQADLESAKLAEQAERKVLAARPGLPADIVPENAITLANRRLSELDGGLKRDQAELEQLSVRRLAWQAEVDHIRALGITALPPPSNTIERNLAVDRSSLAETQRRLGDLRVKLDAARAAAQVEWRKASAGLIDVLLGRETRTTDQTIVDAVRRFTKSQSDYADACDAIDAESNPLLKTWTEQSTDLADRIAANEKLLATTADAREKAMRMISAQGKLDETRARHQQLVADVERQRTERLQLIGDLKEYQLRASKLAQAQDRMNEAELELGNARRLAVAQVAIAFSEAQVETERNPRPAWMLLGGATVLVVAAAAAWLMVLLLSRPRRELRAKSEQPASAEPASA